MDKEYPDRALISEWSNPLNAIPAGFHIDFILSAKGVGAFVFKCPEE